MRGRLSTGGRAADRSGMGATVGASSEGVRTSRRVLWSRARRIAGAILAMIAGVLAGSAEARHALGVPRGSGLRTRVVWIDVEQLRRHPWSANPDANLAVIRGVAAEIPRAGLTPGLYRNTSSWTVITDGAQLGLPEWRTVGPRSRAAAEQVCGAAPLNGGRVVLVQYWTSRADYDVACPRPGSPR